MQNNKKLTISALVLLLLIVSVVYLLSTRGSKIETFVDDGTDFTSVSGDESNSIIVNDQIPGGVIFFQNLSMKEGGFVIVRSSNELGEPGDTLGSLYVEAGESQNGTVALSSPTVEGGTYYIELYEDSNKDKVFDILLDAPVLTTGGKMIRVKIEAMENLPEIKG